MDESGYGGWSLDRFRHDEPGDVQKLIDEKHTERHNLEYKDGAIFGDPNANHELVSEIASLANSGGGVLIVGVSTGAKDVPQGISGTDQEVTHGWLSDLCTGGLQPPVESAGYEVRSFPDPGDASRRCYVIYVPTSTRAPHMVVSQGSGKRNYYGRYLHRTHKGREVMLDSHVRDVMGRRQRPDLALEALGDPHFTGQSIKILLSLENVGAAVAQTATCVFRLPSDWAAAGEAFQQIRHVKRQEVPQGDPWTFVWSVPDPLLPGLPQTLSFRYRYRKRGPDRRGDVHDVLIGLEMHAENMEAVSRVLHVHSWWDAGAFEKLHASVVRPEELASSEVPAWQRRAGD